MQTAQSNDRMLARVSVAQLIGAVLDSPVFDEQGRKLLGTGLTITEEMRLSMRQRGIDTVVVDKGELIRLRAFQPQGTAKCATLDRRCVRILADNEVSREFDAQIEMGVHLESGPKGPPFRDRIKSCGVTSYNREHVEDLRHRHPNYVDQLGQLSGILLSQRSVAIDSARTILQELLQSAVEDLDLLLCLGVNPASGNYPSRHSVHVATLAMSIGATLGCDQTSLMDLGLGCLVHDIGMMAVKTKSYDSTQRLNRSEFEAIAEHPIHLCQLLSTHLDTLPMSSLMVAYQMHERCDGSGYPRMRDGSRIHELAKIGAVADTYIGLVSPRPHRPGLMPYYAMEKLLHDVKAGMFEPHVVRALIQRLSLFPIGSYVATSDGRVGRVVRPNGENYTQPIVELWETPGRGATPDVVDLERENLTIVRPLARLGT